MPPTLRSTTNTPTRATTSTITPNSTPRKPHCSKCHRPRAGHPRSGCPFTEDQSSEGVTEAFESMQLSPKRVETPKRVATPKRLEQELNQLELEDTKAAVRSRRRLSSQQPAFPTSESLVSLSTNSSEIVAALLRPGIFSAESQDAEDAEMKVARWQTTNFAYTPSKKPTRKQLQTLMPGTLSSPTPTASFASIPDAAPVEAGPSSLHRTLTAEDQTLFLEKLGKESSATGYLLPMNDIPAMQSKAMRLGLHSKLACVQDSLGLLVIGREGKAVEKLAEKLEAEGKSNKNGVGSGFRAVAGGAVVGAAATFAGLAFV
ncbi:hypothetical protein C8J56DRAFT_950786 [Mycena floridula]|nr:hypothetical protein C8J56DRAFT_950786 [Mycena floridula]